MITKFKIVTEEEVEKLIKSNRIKICMEDPISAKLHQSLDVALPALTKLINKSLQEGSMDRIKESIVGPLKKAGLDIELYPNFRPVNNLLYLSNLFERAADDQVNGHMTVNNIHEPSQIT